MLKTTSEQSGGRLLTYILNIMMLKRTRLPPLGGATIKNRRFLIVGGVKKIE